MSSSTSDRTVRRKSSVKLEKRQPAMKVALSAILGTSSNLSSTSLDSTSNNNPKMTSSSSFGSISMGRRNSSHHIPMRQSSSGSSHSHLSSHSSSHQHHHHSQSKNTAHTSSSSSQLNDTLSGDLASIRRHSIATTPSGTSNKSTNPFRSNMFDTVSNNSRNSTAMSELSPRKPVHIKTDTELLSTMGKRYLRDYLKERGLLEKKLIFTSDNIKIAVADSGNTVFLPASTRRNDAYYARMNGLEDEDSHEDEYLARHDTYSGNRSNLNSGNTSASQNTGSRTRSNTSGSRGTSYSQSNQQASDDSESSMQPYNIAIIITVKHTTNLKDIEATLFSKMRVFWKDGVPPTKSFKEEVYNYGSLNWTLNHKNYDLYIPCKVSSKDKIINNNHQARKLEVFKNMAQSGREYRDSSHSKEAIFNRLATTKTRSFHSGTYIFMLPTAFMEDIPETLYYPSARVGYRLSIAAKIVKKDENKSTNEHFQLYAGTSTGSQDSLKEIAEAQPTVKHSSSTSLFKRVKSTLTAASETNDHSKDHHSSNRIYVEYPLTIIRTPPPVSTTTANRSIYVNRTWADALGYEISLGQKYIPLGSKIPIKLKVTPLTKDIKLHRIRVNIMEKISFVSMNYEYEFDQVDVIAKDPYSPYYKNFQSMRRKCRSLSLLEIRSKDKGGHALREEVVENCFAGNLLAYESIKDFSKKSDKERPEIGINESVVIETNIEFPKFVDLDRKSTRNVPPYGVDNYTTLTSTDLEDAKQTSTKHRSGLRDFFSPHSSSDLKEEELPVSDPRLHETRMLTNTQNNVKFNSRLHNAKRGLYVDSFNCANISCKHKLEIMFRVSKRDNTNTSKIRNYEVVLDIPVIIVSDKCVVDTMELPTYSMALMDNKVPNGTSNNNEVSDNIFPPSFEEVFSVPASPLGSPFASPTASPRLSAMYTNEDLSEQYLPLSQNVSMLSLNRMGDSSNETGRARYGSIPDISSTSASKKQFSSFGNLDNLLGSPKHGALDDNLVRSGDGSNLIAVDVPYCLYTPDRQKKSAEVPMTDIFGNQINTGVNSSVFKENYTLGSGSDKNLDEKEDIYHEVEGPGLTKLLTKSDPPTYDDIVSNS